MSSRREFLQQGTLLSGALCFSPYLSDFYRKVKKPGLQLWTFKDSLSKDLDSILKNLAEAGFKELEGFGLDNEEMKYFFNAEVKAKMKDLGLNLVASHGSSQRSADKSTSKGIDHFAPTWKKTVDLGLEMGIKYITIPYTPEDLRKTVDDFQSCAEALNKLGEYATRQGLKFSYHNHDFEFKVKEGLKMYDILLRECDPEIVQMELDIYWVKAAQEDPVKIFKKNPGRFPQLHLKDMDLKDPKKNADFGSGSINFKEILAASKIAGVKHFFIEQESGFNPNPMKSAQKGIYNLKQLKF